MKQLSKFGIILLVLLISACGSQKGLNVTQPTAGGTNSVPTAGQTSSSSSSDSSTSSSSDDATVVIESLTKDEIVVLFNELVKPVNMNLQDAIKGLSDILNSLVIKVSQIAQEVTAQGTLLNALDKDLDTAMLSINSLVSRVTALENRATGSSVQMYRCVYETPGDIGGGAWGFMGCVGQLTDRPTCQTIAFPTVKTNNCTPAGVIKLLPNGS